MPKIINREEEKRAIATKLLELIAVDGYYNVGLRVVARDLGFSKTKIYHYFSSKSELMDYCFPILLEKAVGFKREGGNVSTKILKLLNYYESVLTEFKNEQLLLIDYLRDNDIDKAHAEYQVHSYIDRIIQELSSYLGIDIKKATVVQAIIVGMLMSKSFSNKSIDKSLMNKSIMAVL